MAIVRDDLPTQETMDEWNTFQDVAAHFATDVADITAVLESLGGQVTDGLAVLASADASDVKDGLADWAEKAKPKAMRMTRMLLMINAVRVAKGKSISEEIRPDKKQPELPTKKDAGGADDAASQARAAQPTHGGSTGAQEEPEVQDAARGGGEQGRGDQGEK